MADTPPPPPHLLRRSFHFIDKPQATHTYRSVFLSQMGKCKIEIRKIQDDRKRQATFLKRVWTPPLEQRGRRRVTPPLTRDFGREGLWLRVYSLSYSPSAVDRPSSAGADRCFWPCVMMKGTTRELSVSKAQWKMPRIGPQSTALMYILICIYKLSIVPIIVPSEKLRSRVTVAVSRASSILFLVSRSQGILWLH